MRKGGRKVPVMGREEACRRVDAAIRAAGYTNAEAARKLGWSDSRTWSYARGGKVPGWTLLVYMVEVLGLDLDVLFAPVGPESGAEDGRSA
jgi:transcriptional regulator with XRE-family HTH domain